MKLSKSFSELKSKASAYLSSLADDPYAAPREAQPETPDTPAQDAFSAQAPVDVAPAEPAPAAPESVPSAFSVPEPLDTAPAAPEPYTPAPEPFTPAAEPCTPAATEPRAVEPAAMPSAYAAEDWEIPESPQETGESRKIPRALRIVLFILIGVPLLVAGVLVTFALYLALWALIVAAYLVVFAAILVTLALLGLGIYRFGASLASGLFLFGAGLTCASLAALLLLGVNAFTPMPSRGALYLYSHVQRLVLRALKGGDA